MMSRAHWVISLSLVACVENTTSLGGARGSQTSASSAPDDDAASGPASYVPPNDAAVFGSCRWYSWDPVETDTACEYLLPSPPDDDPNLDPKTWNPHNVRVEILEPQQGKTIGGYAATSTDCGADDGWHYVEPGGRESPKRFKLCPKTCNQLLSANDTLLRLSASSGCQ